VAILDAIAALRQKKPVVLIAIDGGGGSGKTTFANELAAKLGEAEIVSMDTYYHRPAGEDTYSERDPIYQYFDIETLKLDVLEPIHSGKSPKLGVVIVEGIGTLGIKLRDYFDYKIWLEASPATRRSRGLQRDSEDHAQIWDTHYLPEDARYIAEQSPADVADVIVPTD
jgi:uridine kinase